MIDLGTTYMGLKLLSPIIAASSGLTNSVKHIVDLEKHGAGAVVLKSIFEEQILLEKREAFDKVPSDYPEAYDYVQNYAEESAIDKYLTLISEAKKAVFIPIIASVNCVTASNWESLAIDSEKAGADALEINLYTLPSDPNKSSADIEKIYFELIENITSKVSIPVSIKIGPQFTALAQMVTKLSWTNIKGIVLFNRFFSPDIDIETLEVSSAKVLSGEHDYHNTLRWTSILSPLVQCDIAASTGIHDGETAIKMLLAGAKVVEVASSLYEHGISYIRSYNSTIEKWMERNEYSSLDEVIGKVSYKRTPNPAAFERVQFMKYFSGIE